MLPSFGSAPTSRATQCKVCDQPLVNGSGVKGQAVCRSFDCMRLVQQQGTMPETLYTSIFKVQSKLIREKHARGKAEEARKTAIDRQIQALDQQLHDQLEADENLSLPKDLLLLSIASGGRQISNLPAKRKKKFRDNLNAAISEATSNIEFEDVGVNINSNRLKRSALQYREVSGLKEQTQNVCIQCQGACCIAGADKGFVEIQLLRRVMTEQPGLRPRDLYQLYMQHLPNKSVKGSCIFHTQTGCNLPRKLRSDVCNGYLCEPVETMQKKSYADQKLRPALVVSRNYRQFHKYDDGAKHDVLVTAKIEGGEVQRIDAVNLE